MCGIVSFFNDQKHVPKKIEDAFRDMLWIDSIRGYHSTGLIFESNGNVDHFKKAITGWDFIQLAHPQSVLNNLGKTRYVIGHNRAATRGAVNHDNAHPFEFDHIVGVHNGTLVNHYSLNVGTFNVDSMYLYKALSLKPTEEIIPKIKGSFNLLWHDNRDNTVHVLRNHDRTYSFLKIKGERIMIGASEREMAKWLLKRRGLEIEYVWDPKPLTEYIFDVDESMIKAVHKIKHRGYVEPPKKQSTVLYLPENKGQKAGGGTSSGNGRDTCSVSDEQKIEFFIDHFEYNKFVDKDKGRVTATAYGYSSAKEEEEVVIFGVFPEDHQLNTWYVGSAWWIADGKEGYWTVKPDTMREHPSDDPSEVFHDCCMCNRPEAESDMVYISANPYCTDCCQQLNVTTEMMDDPNDAIKLFVH